MNLIIFGAGASRATHNLPTTDTAILSWARVIREEYRLLALALDWVAPTWQRQEVNLEEVWTAIDVAWKERGLLGVERRIPDLDLLQRRSVWQIAAEEAQREAAEPSYYGPQLRWARQQQWSAEQFLSVTAGWELHRLLQSRFTIQAEPRRCRPYTRVSLAAGQPTTVISFNYDTLVEQCLEREGRRWTYAVPAPERDVLVLKPHGSVNIAHVRERGTDHVREGLQLRVQDMGYQGERFVQNLVVGLRDKTEHTAAEPSDPIRRHFRIVLDACEAALRRAEKVWIVGYSFPSADTSFLDVVARALAGREEGTLSLIVIDKGEGADVQAQQARLEELFGIALVRPIRYCPHGFETWAGSHDCGSAIKKARSRRRAT